MRAGEATIEEVAISPLTAWTYRHQARRLRHQFRHDPVGLHMSLRALAVKANQVSRVRERHEHLSRRVSPATRVVSAAAETARPVAVSDVRFADSPRTASFEKRSAPRLSPSQVNQPESRPDADTAAALQTPVDSVEKFSVLVRTMLGEGILRYSRRKALMRQARKLGIRPFEASLLIATIENRMVDEPRSVAYTLRPPRRYSVLLGVISLLVLEVAAVGLLAMMLL